jgi:PPOX class probable F420-dependent enzyme
MLSDRLRAFENKVAKAVRDPRSAQIRNEQATTFNVRGLFGHRYILLVTTRRDGGLIATPMWFAAEGERRLVLRSGATDPKLKRIRHNAHVKIAACDVRGRPLGAPMEARARILRHSERDPAELLLKRTLGWQRSLYNFFRAPLLPMSYIEITSGDQPVQRGG